MIENTILSSLIHNEEYARKVVPFIKDEYFGDNDTKVLFQEIRKYIDQYNGLPTKEALQISIDERDDLNEERYKNISESINDMGYDNDTELDWLLDKTEKFCQDKAVYNAVRKSILVLDGKDKEYDKGAIPQLLSDALGVAFDTNIGHDFVENADQRFDFYHTKEDKIPFDLDYMNKITKGGVSRKSLSIALAGTGVGKTLFMTHCAAANLMEGLNVLYITMEMAEERIAERIDANLLDLTLDDLRYLTRDVYHSRMSNIRKRTNGKLIVKEYPTASAGSNHFRFLLNELKLKKNFIPDIIYIDYLNICMSSRMKQGANVNSYTYIKAIAEELRGLAVEFNVPVFSATQTTRSGYSNSDMDLTDTSESFGLPATADFMFGLISSEELENLGQIMVKQLKNRWGDIANPKRFVVGIDRSRMKLFNVEESAQENLTNDSKPKKQREKTVMDNSAFGERYEEDSKITKFRGKKPNFEGFA
jgi:replicative DNA helicase